jgi:hypothetical protein
MVRDQPQANASHIGSSTGSESTRKMYDVEGLQLTAFLGSFVIMVRLRRMSSKPVMMLPMLNINEMELIT